MKVFKPPEFFEVKNKSIFLAGSIEMGKAEDWQKEVEKAFEEMDVTLLNPRRDNWDSSWEQSINNPNFKEQVEWELSALECSDLILLYLSPGTISPISLFELGFWALSSKLIVCCPPGFHRKGNVDIVCKRYNIHQVDSLEQLIYAGKKFIIN